MNKPNSSRRKLIALLAVILLALTVLALPVKTVTDTPWLAALVRPFASLMGISQGDLTDTPMADAGSVTGAAQPVSVSVRNPAGRTSFQYSFSTLDASFEQFGAALGQALETAQETERTSALRVQEALGYYVGKTLIVQTLRGSRDRRLLQLGLDRLSTYGLMQKLSAEKVLAMLDRLEEAGYLRTNAQHFTLEPTAAANGVLFGGEKVSMPVRVEPAAKSAGKSVVSWKRRGPC